MDQLFAYKNTRTCVGEDAEGAAVTVSTRLHHCYPICTIQRRFATGRELLYRYTSYRGRPLDDSTFHNKFLKLTHYATVLRGLGDI